MPCRPVDDLLGLFVTILVPKIDTELELTILFVTGMTLII